MYRLTIVGFIGAFLLIGTTLQAVEVDVTIKAVDAKARGITVTYETKLGQKSIDLDVSRKAEITVNGESGTLESVKPGQKAKVTYEKELQIVTKIVATGQGTPPGREVWQLRLTVSEFGDCTMKVERTTMPPSVPANSYGESIKLALLPNAQAQKASDGSIRITHSFDHPDELSKIFDVTRQAELTRELGAVTFMPHKDQPAAARYWSRFEFPAVVCFSELPTEQRCGILLHMFVGPTGFVGVNFGRGTDDKTFTEVFWWDMNNGKPKQRTQILQSMPFDIAEGVERKFRLPLPNVRIQETGSLQLVGWGDEGTKASVVHLMVQGCLHPSLGCDFAERMGLVFVQSIVPGGFAEKAGVKVGDVVLAINGDKPQSVSDAMRLYGKVPIGDDISITIRRGDKESELKIAIK